MARQRNPKGDVDRLMQALDAVRGETARSSLYRWLRKNHDEFIARLDGERADWLALTQAFAAIGLADRTGKPASPATARMTWRKVRQEVAKARERKEAKPAPSLAPGEIAPGVWAAPPPSSVAAEARRPAVKLDIKPARPRLESPADQPSLARRPAPDPETPPRHAASSFSTEGALSDEKVEADLSRLREQMNARKAPIPKPI